MSINIVENIMSRLGGNNINQLSSVLGESPDRTKTAVGATVPALLAGLSNVASTPEGAHRISNAISQQDPNLDENYSSALADTSRVNPDTSSNLLTNLLGGGLSTNLTSILGRFTGMKGSSITSLMGAIAPLALACLGRQQRAAGLDASGLAGFLGSQKQNIAAAMPSGLSSVLGSIPGFSGFTTQKVPETEYAHAGRSPAFAETAAGERLTEYARHEHASPMRWLLPLLIIAALAWAFYAWNRSRSVHRVEEPIPTVNQPIERNIPATPDRTIPVTPDRTAPATPNQTVPVTPEPLPAPQPATPPK